MIPQCFGSRRQGSILLPPHRQDSRHKFCRVRDSKTQGLPGQAGDLGKGFFAQNGYEYAFVLAVAALTLAFTASGPFSIDAIVGLARTAVFRGIAALLAGLVVGGTALLEWRKAPVQQAATK
jgi:hypothetical protein